MFQWKFPNVYQAPLTCLDLNCQTLVSTLVGTNWISAQLFQLSSCFLFCFILFSLSHLGVLPDSLQFRVQPRIWWELIYEFGGPALMTSFFLVFFPSQFSASFQTSQTPFSNSSGKLDCEILLKFCPFHDLQARECPSHISMYLSWCDSFPISRVESHSFSVSFW